MGASGAKEMSSVSLSGGNSTPNPVDPGPKRFARLAWASVLYTIAVIVFGAFVRATHSGDGCGAHWPKCDGVFVPLNPSAEMLIEFTHRVTSGIAGLLSIGLVFFAFRWLPRRHPSRLGAILTFVFMMIEAGIGAILVKQGLVGDNDSVHRAVYMAVHLCNTFLLLAAMVATAFWAKTGATPKFRGQGAAGFGVLLGAAAILLLGVSGAVTALGDTLFPAQTLTEGLTADFSSTAHFLVRLRLLHPLIAVSVGVLVVLVSVALSHSRPRYGAPRYASALVGLFVTQLFVGMMNVILLAPVWMQLVHLAIADALWVAFVLLGLTSLTSEPADLDSGERERPGARNLGELARAYVALTKPRVISLLLFTTLMAALMANGGWPGWPLFLSVAIGGYLAAGAANAINMFVDRDIDREMVRTATRPTVTEVIPPINALYFGFFAAVASFLILWSGANLLAASLAMAGLLFYVFIYTLMLKRRTWHNIVVGGAAGSFPPLVGWAAVTGDLNFFAWVLFALIFVWTPVHFWALAILIKDDYAAAGVPMLPVVRGDRATILQIALYAVLTTLVSALPLLDPRVGPSYLPAALILNAGLLWLCARLYRRPVRREALFLFKYSMVYLALLFATLAIDRTWVG